MPDLKPTLLLILDGWGYAPPGPGNAPSLANTPNIDGILNDYPHVLVKCSGRAVGLPDGFMGNSEVGHMNIGAGRVVYQDMTRIDVAIEQGAFEDNPVLNRILETAKAGTGRLHIMGLISDGGVHSHVRHLHALLRMAKKRDVQVLVHAFLDGRDTPPTSGLGYVRDLLAEMDTIGAGRIASVSGRYWAMDRDKRWDRVKLAYDALTLGRGVEDFDPSSPLDAIRQSYDKGENDEFVKPRVMCGMDGKPVGTVRDGDAVFFFNFRADRAKQITRAFIEDDFSEFERKARPKLAIFATMTQYEADFGVPVAFPPEEVKDTLGEVVSGLGVKQLRIAETEKYAHVTYFLNCGVEDPLPGEERKLIQSPREVATYDEKPEMSCPEVTDNLLEKWATGQFPLVVCNLANLDMVGHTGIIPAAIKACEAVDTAVGRIRDTVLASGGRILMTADHGNAEEMLDKNGRPQTAHSTNPVSVVRIEDDIPTSHSLREGGILGDIAPTILDLWGVTQPESMTGQSLVKKIQGAGDE